MFRRRHHDTPAQQPDEGTGASGERDTPGADEFVVTRESHVPWADAPIIREDEHYERLNEGESGSLSPRDRLVLDELDS